MADEPMVQRRPWSKRRFLAVSIAVQAAVAYLLWPLAFWGFDFGEVWRSWHDPGYAAWMGLSVLLVSAGQAAFLMPVRRPRAVQTPGRGWSKHLLGGLAIGAITSYAVFLGAICLEAYRDLGDTQLWLLLAVPAAVATPLGMLILGRCCRDGTPVLLSVLIAACVGASLLAGLVLAASSVATILGKQERWAHWPVAFGGTLAGAWAIGTPLLWAYCRRRDPETALGRIASRLFLGTIVEAGAIIPLDVMVRRKTDCYCGEGTMWALTICWAAGTVVLGPFVWLIPMGRRRRRWYAGRCPVCEYDMRGCREAERCPECGAGWRPARPPA